MESEERIRPGRGLLYILIGAVAFAAIAVFLRNLEAFIDAVEFYVDIYVTSAIIAIVGLIGLGFWLRGHQIYAKSKGRTPFWGLILGLLPVLGLIILAALPAHSGTDAEAAAGAVEAADRTSEAETPAPEGEQHGS